MDLKYGMVHSEARCLGCGESTVCFNELTSLSLPVSNLQRVKMHVVKRHSDSGSQIEAGSVHAIQLEAMCELDTITEKASVLAGVSKERLTVYKAEERSVAAEGLRLMDVAGTPHAAHLSLTPIAPSRPLSLVPAKGKPFVSLYVFESTLSEEEDPREPAMEISKKEFPLWSETVRVGMRVDACDPRQQWFPGSVVEVADDAKSVKVHFDNFSSKWDETYPLAGPSGEKLAPFGTRAPAPKDPKMSTLILHEVLDYPSGKHVEFGMPGFIDFWREWSVGRALAHMLAQASRFLKPNGPSDLSELQLDILYGPSRAAVASLIEILVAGDRDVSKRRLEGASPADIVAIDESVSAQASNLLNDLPFEVVLRTRNAKGTEKDEPFPLSLACAVANVFNSRNVAVLRWKRQLSSSVLLYGEPELAEYATCTALSREQTAFAHSIYDCLKDYSSPFEVMHYNCRFCKKLGPCERRLQLWKLPDILHIELQRFACTSKWRQKITKEVDFPLTGMDPSSFFHGDAPNSKCLYDLAGVISHHGTLTSGHYTSIYDTLIDVTSAHDASLHQAQWMSFDDDRVSSVSADRVVSSDAYILVYRRRNMTPSNICKYLRP